MAAGSGTLKVDIYSRHLQWLRSTDEVADAVALKDIHFAGPIEIQAEYPNGGADNAQDRITLPREQVLGAMKRDLLTLRRGLAGYSPA